MPTEGQQPPVGMVRDFLLPDLGEGLTEGEILEWQVEPGDHIDLNQTVCIVETAKAAVEIPSPFAGRVVERIGDVGQMLEVGSPLVRIEVEEVAAGADLSAVAAPVDRAGGDAAADAGGDAPRGDALGDDDHPQLLVGYGERTGARARRRHRHHAAGTGDGHRDGAGDGQAAAAGGGAATTGAKPMAKPPVRRLAKDLGVDLAAVAPGSGPGGIVTRDDVRRAAREDTPAPREALRPAARAGGGDGATSGEGRAPAGFRGMRPGDVVPVRAVRRRIAERVATSRRQIPHAAAEQWADCTALWSLRARLAEQAAAEGSDVRVTPFVLVLRAAVLSLRRFPTLNATFADDDGDTAEIRLHDAVHLGIATDTDRGLLVPVVRDAHTLSTLQLAEQVARVARAARDGSIAPTELVGSTFSVTNYGAFGNDDGDPVINHPEGAILGVGAMRERPWVVAGEVAVRRVAKLKVVFDHRISDGGEAGRFIAHLAALCEDPGRMLLHA